MSSPGPPSLRRIFLDDCLGTEELDEQPVSLSGNLGAISQNVTIDIPYSNVVSFYVTLELQAGADAIGSPAPGTSWVESADFQNTLTVLGLGVVGAPGVALNPTSGYEYPALNSTPEPSTFFLAFGIIGTCFLARVCRVAVQNSGERRMLHKAA